MPRLPAPPASPDNILGFALTMSLLSLTTDFPPFPTDRSLSPHCRLAQPGWPGLPAGSRGCAAVSAAAPEVSAPPSHPVPARGPLEVVSAGHPRLALLWGCAHMRAVPAPCPCSQQHRVRAARKPAFVVLGGEGKEREREQCFNKSDFSANEMAAALSSEVSRVLH